MVQNENTETSLDRPSTDLVLAGYEQQNEGDYNTNTKHTHEENTTVAVTSLVDQIIINNIEEEEDENIDNIDVDKDTTNKIEYSPGTHPPRRMNKTLSQVSNMGKE